MAIDMARHFTTKDLLRFAAPSVAMMIFTSIYGVVDGFFVSNFAGKTAFAAVNFIMPFIMILSSVGFMVGTGGTAVVATMLGAGQQKRANESFTLLVVFTLVLGAVLAVLGALFMEQVAWAMGARDEMLDLCVLYGRISMVSLPFFMLQYAFQAFFPGAGKPSWGLGVTVASGVANMVGDAVLVGALSMGVAGAAWATVASEYIGGLVPIIYFAAQRKGSLLRFTRFHWDGKVVGKTCVNGSSEMMANIAMSVVGMVYNVQLLNYLGEDGVSAYGVIMYAGFVFGALFEGYVMGVAPLMSFQHGANNAVEKRSLFRSSLKIVGVAAVAVVAVAELGAPGIAGVFTGYDQGLHALTVHAFRIYSAAFLLMGFSYYGSSLFTALGNGLVSAVISFLRTLVFECGAVLLLPLALGADGIWMSVTVAEVVSVCLVAGCIAKLGPRYGIVGKEQA